MCGHNILLIVVACLKSAAVHLVRFRVVTKEGCCIKLILGIIMGVGKPVVLRSWVIQI